VLVKGSDYSTPYDVSATYQLRCSPSTLRVVEQVKLVFSSVSIVDGTTLDWPNTERVGDESCLTQEERDEIAEYLKFAPKKASFHTQPVGTPLPAVPNELQQRQWSPTPSQEVEQRVRTQLFSEEDGAEEEQLISIDSILEQ
jgi:hypothetical protein